ncbi:hypothetical protein BH09PLA1_BH09PLA1_34670 [soil metagenome]
MTQIAPEHHEPARPKPVDSHYENPWIAMFRRFISEYFWFVFKNVIGWIFILGALPVGIAVPGPGGIPLFLIGFALVTFPGKRKLTTRVMRGVAVRFDPAYFTFLITVLSILITAGVLWFVKTRYEEQLQSADLKINAFQLLGVVALAAGITWLTMRILLAALNWFLRRLPTLRRKIRPWLRKKGINLLPPRRKRTETIGVTEDRPVDEVVTFDAKYSRNLRSSWTWLKPWLKRMFAVGITIAIFVRIVGPIKLNWSNPDVQARLQRLDVIPFLVAAAMFAGFLFVFRAMAWRRILAKLGHPLPIAAATRIWSTSELARYVPGAIFQVIGRVYLIKPYGVRGSVTSVSQILELALFLLANVLVAVSCLLYFGIKHLHGAARGWMYVATLLVPILLFFLHPKICYGLINMVMRRLKKPHIANPLSASQMLMILGWNVLGLIWQSLAVYLLTQDVLGLKADWWWVIAGAYCLAWCAGFLAVWAPGGIGVRELVFVAAMNAILPEEVKTSLGDPIQRQVILGFLSLLLRLWATIGELILAAAAYLLDYRGALGRSDAPGRVAGFSSSSSLSD